MQLEDYFGFLASDDIRIKDEITRALDQVYTQESSATDLVLMQMQLASLPHEDW